MIFIHIFIIVNLLLFVYRVITDSMGIGYWSKKRIIPTTSSAIDTSIKTGMDRVRFNVFLDMYSITCISYSFFRFSECGIPISYDTKGVVRMFSNQYGLSWLPVVDCSSLLNQKGDHYFIVGMTHNPNEMRYGYPHNILYVECAHTFSLPLPPLFSLPLSHLLSLLSSFPPLFSLPPSLSLFIRVILCKGLDYPPVHPRPVMTTIPLTFPLCDPKTEKTNIEV